MAKWLSAHTVADAHVNLGTIIIKQLQSLVFWLKDHQKRGLMLDATEFTAAAMSEAGHMKVMCKDMKEASVPDVKDLGKFDPELFKAYEDSFHNLLAQTIGVRGEPLHYVIRDQMSPATFVTMDQERMYQIPLTGEEYDVDNVTVYHKLKAFLIDGPGWAWIEPYDSTKNGHATFIAWCNHYNGQGELSKQLSLAKSRLSSLFYKNECSMSFECYSEQLQCIFQVLEKDLDEAYLQHQQVEALQKGIQTDDAELRSAKVIISSQYPRDFVGACAFFSAKVARLHGPAQIEAKCDHRHHISAVDTNSSGGRGCGCGHFGGYSGGQGGCNGCGSQGGHGGRGTHQMVINGINISEKHETLQTRTLQYNGGRAYVMQANSNQTGRGPGHGDGGRGSRGHNVGAVNTQQQDNNANDSSNSCGHGHAQGGQNGCGFGRGAYGGNLASQSDQDFQ